MSPTLAESVKERKDALQKVHSITNVYTNGFTPSKLETLSEESYREEWQKGTQSAITCHISID